MRISTAQMFSQGVDVIERQQSPMLQTQQQIASGRRVLTPADDPVAGKQAIVPSQEQCDTHERSAAIVRELLANTLIFGVVERPGYPLELAREAREVAAMARGAGTADAVAQLGFRLKLLWIALEERGDDQREIQESLLRLLAILCGNVDELIGDDAWLRGQIRLIAMLASGPIDRTSLAQMERGLREVVFKQGTPSTTRTGTRPAILR